MCKCRKYSSVRDLAVAIYNEVAAGDSNTPYRVAQRIGARHKRRERLAACHSAELWLRFSRERELLTGDAK